MVTHERDINSLHIRLQSLVLRELGLCLLWVQNFLVLARIVPLEFAVVPSPEFCLPPREMRSQTLIEDFRRRRRSQNLLGDRFFEC